MCLSGLCVICTFISLTIVKILLVLGSGFVFLEVPFVSGTLVKILLALGSGFLFLEVPFITGSCAVCFWNA